MSPACCAGKRAPSRRRASFNVSNGTACSVRSKGGRPVVPPPLLYRFYPGSLPIIRHDGDRTKGQAKCGQSHAAGPSIRRYPPAIEITSWGIWPFRLSKMFLVNQFSASDLVLKVTGVSPESTNGGDDGVIPGRTSGMVAKA